MPVSRSDRRRFLSSTVRGLWTLGAFAALRPRLTFAAPTTQADAISPIAELAASSPIASYDWKNRGRAPIGYVKGMAVSFARTYFALTTRDAATVEMAKAVTDDPTRDALTHYADAFQAAGMDNSQPGPETLRHLFVLMVGLGMRESSGRYCEGRDRSASNTTAETAEAGLFQTSYNARHASPLMPPLFARFSTHPAPSYLNLFSEGVHARDADLENFGAGDGEAFQKLSKDCPFFAVQFAAVGLRNIRKHWGPINRRDAEIKSEADDLLRQVQALVDKKHIGPAL